VLAPFGENDEHEPARDRADGDEPFFPAGVRLVADLQAVGLRVEELLRLRKPNAVLLSIRLILGGILLESHHTTV